MSNATMPIRFYPPKQLLSNDQRLPCRQRLCLAHVPTAPPYVGFHLFPGTGGLTVIDLSASVRCDVEVTPVICCFKCLIFYRK